MYAVYIFWLMVELVQEAKYGIEMPFNLKNALFTHTHTQIEKVYSNYILPENKKHPPMFKYS
jgi:hypothetical protein